jgi:regulator of sirC expression with transglutaminase-like and TPR domain
MQQLLDLLIRKNESVSLDVAALQLAMIEDPDLSPDPFLALLDSHAAELGERVSDETSGDDFVEIMNDYMIEELGFHGNEQDYYNAKNSCLNEVLAQRTGIPITLALVYIEIGRRLQRPFFGIGLPGHFLAQYNDGEYSTYIDPYHGGRLLEEQDCFDLAKEITGLDVSADPRVLLPVSKRHIIVRMLNNLRAVYFRNQDPQKAVEVLNLLIQVDPSSPDEYKQRGVCRAQMNLYKSARNDLEMYLKLAPAASDRKEVEEQIERMKQFLAKIN